MFALGAAGVRRCASAAVACAADGDCSGAGAYYEPKCVAMQTLPERAALGGGDGGVAFFGDRR
jgi:hypothetical protein